MGQILKHLSLHKEKYFETHLSFINCVLPTKMTPMEIKVVSSFMSLEGELANYRFGPTAKKVVMAHLNISPAGLSNYINALLDKGFLIRAGDVLSIFPILVPAPDEQSYVFKLTNVDYAAPTTS